MSKTARQVRNEKNIEQGKVVKVNTTGNFAVRMTEMLKDVIQLYKTGEQFTCSQTGLLFSYNKTKLDGTLNEKTKQVYEIELNTYLDDGTPVYKVVDIDVNNEKFNNFYRYHADEFDYLIGGGKQATMFCKSIEGKTPYRYENLDEHKKAMFALLKK